MAENTDKNLRTKVIYSVFVRNYSEEGTFEAVRNDLDRIRGLGTDIIWLMPIHPCGKKNRKGKLGSPYSISDYRDVNPEFGTKEDFRRLVESIHEKKMSVIIDVVYNHTSRDSVLSSEHPEWFFHKEDGNFGNKTGDWWDVIDLDYSNQELWNYQIETLKMWAGEYKVDGFRCDVASMVPSEFWKKARAEVEKVRPNAIWLSESVEPSFIKYNRLHGIQCSSDSEIFQAFDISYEYDIFGKFKSYLSGENDLSSYSDAINGQEIIYPENYVKLRFLENHDNLRAKFLIRNEKSLLNWTSFIYFQKGTVLIYNGQEAEETHTPSLFDKDTIDWKNLRNTEPLQKLMRRMSEIKKDSAFAGSSYFTKALPEDVMIACHTENAKKLNGKPGKRIFGIFSFKGNESVINIGERNSDFAVPDGFYTNLINGKKIEINMGILSSSGEPLIFEVKE